MESFPSTFCGHSYPQEPRERGFAAADEASKLGILPLAVLHSCGGLKLSSPCFHAAGKGLCVQLGIRRKIFEKNLFFSELSPALWAKVAL